jgi:hypothetical protein
LDAPIALAFEGGSNTNTLTWHVTSLGFVGVDTPLFLRVEVWPTDFAIGFADVYVNDVKITNYCSPDENCGSEWHACVSSFMVIPFIDPALGGSLRVTVQTSGVQTTGCDYDDQYPLYVKMALNSTRFAVSDVPSGQPSAEPSTQPSGEPSAPSHLPSVEPTSHPSLVPTFYPSSASFEPLTFSGGSHNESVVWNVEGLGVISGPLYFTGEVYPTNFPTNFQQADVYVNGNLVHICRPLTVCGADFHLCFDDMNIADRVLTSHGGSLQIEVRSRGVVSSECDYQTYPLYVRFGLSDKVDTFSEGDSLLA